MFTIHIDFNYQLWEERAPHYTCRVGVVWSSVHKHVEYVILRWSPDSPLVCISLYIFFMTTSNHIIFFGGNTMYDFQNFLVDFLFKKKKNHLCTNKLQKYVYNKFSSNLLHIFFKLVEICSHLLHKDFKLKGSM